MGVLIDTDDIYFLLIIKKITASKGTYKVIKNKWRKKKRKKREIEHQLVTIKWKIKSSLEKMENKEVVKRSKKIK